MQFNEIPVLLLTGYLGSGKTTLLNRILNNRKGIRFAVVVNDIGEVNIDAELIQQGGVVGKKDDSLVALQNGCICCTLKMDLVDQLRQITLMQRFDYIVIEASGICEPAPIAQTICSIPSMGPEFCKGGVPVLDCICTVVDALRMRDEFKNGSSLTRKGLDEDDIENLLIQQIEFCNIVLLNKKSEVSEADLELIRQIIKALQPSARIIECDWCDIDLDSIVGTGMFDFDQVAGSAGWIKGVEGPVEDDDEDDDDEDDDHEHHHEHHHDHHHEHHHEHHHHDEGEAEEYGISSFVYCRRQPFDINKFDNFVAKHWPKEVIRAKGMCYFTDEYDVCYVFEQAGRQISMRNAGRWFATMPEDELQQMMVTEPTLQRDWDPVYGDRMQKLVFIGRKMDRKAICDALDESLLY